MSPRTASAPESSNASRPGKIVPVENACNEADESRVRITGYVRYKAKVGEGGRVTIDGILKVIPGDPKAPGAPKSCYVNVEWASPG